jgi:ABC-type multidrug transport system ATPase subunit
MDEPTNALDPAATDDLLDFVKTEILPAGKSILWATHRLDEVMMLCDDVVLLIRGVLAFRGTVTELLELRKRGDSWRIDFYALDRDLEKISTFVKAIGGELQRGPSSFRLILRSGREQQDPAGVFSKLLDLGARIESLQPDVCSLNELFVDLLDTNGIV